MANQIVQLKDSSNNNLYPKEAVIDISSSITYNLSFGLSRVKAYYYPNTGTVRGHVGLNNATTTTFNYNTAVWTIAEKYRPSSGFELSCITRTSSGTYITRGAIDADGGIRQVYTSNALEMYMAFEYTI